MCVVDSLQCMSVFATAAAWTQQQNEVTVIALYWQIESFMRDRCNSQINQIYADKRPKSENIFQNISGTRDARARDGSFMSAGVQSSACLGLRSAEACLPHPGISVLTERLQT